MSILHLYRSEKQQKTETRSNRRRLCYGIVIFTVVFYGGFIVHKLIKVTSFDEAVAEQPIVEPKKIVATFRNDPIQLDNDQYVRAADAEDQRLLNKVRYKNRPQDLNLTSPRAHWHENIKKLEELEAQLKKLGDVKDESLELEVERLRRVAEDKPAI